MKFSIKFTIVVNFDICIRKVLEYFNIKCEINNKEVVLTIFMI